MRRHRRVIIALIFVNAAIALLIFPLGGAVAYGVGWITWWQWLGGWYGFGLIAYLFSKFVTWRLRQEGAVAPVQQHQQPPLRNAA